MGAGDLVLVDYGGDVVQHDLAGKQVSLVSLKMGTEEIISAADSLHLCILYDPLFLHLLDYAVVLFRLLLPLVLRLFLRLAWLFYSLNMGASYNNLFLCF